MRPFLTLVAAAAVALSAVSSGHAAPRMYMGFLDDTSFRWSADRASAFDAAKAADASVLRTIVRWSDVAPTRPARAADPWDPAYRFDDLDEFMRSAQQRGIEALLTIWGTPTWANGGAAPNVPPADARDFRDFVRAVATRYSGAYPGFPFARFFSIWNEPNSERFLRSDDPPAAYAALAEAGVAGVRAGSPKAFVAVGETAARHRPAAFMAAVARLDPTLDFDAWSHHPYPPTAAGSPDSAAAWPNVGLRELGRFGRAVDSAFGRVSVPLWVTEYGESTTAVPPARQAADLARAVRLAGRLRNVDMLVWLMLRDHVGEPWQSGLVGKPSLNVFRRAAGPLDPRNAFVEVDADAATHALRVPALELRWHIPASARVGVRYTLRTGRRSILSGMTAARIGRDGWVPVALSFRPRPGATYALKIEIEDVHGFAVGRTLSLVAA